MRKPLNWYLRRHPLLYKIRFRLVSKKSSVDTIENFCYNDINKKSKIDPLFFKINNLIFENPNEELSDFEKAKKIVVWLKSNIKGGPGLGKSSVCALQKMIDGKGGVCSDFSQIYNNFCVINNIKVKEWGMRNLSENPNVSGGHSFNEVYCQEFQKWIIIDPGKSILFYQANSDIPLSTLEYIHLKKEKKEILISSIVENESLNTQNLNAIFLDSESQLFVITNYNNKTIDVFLDKLNFLPESIIHGILILAGKGYNYEFPIQ
jgi:hypothetical protein